MVKWKTKSIQAYKLTFPRSSICDWGCKLRTGTYVFLIQSTYCPFKFQHLLLRSLKQNWLKIIYCKVTSSHHQTLDQTCSSGMWTSFLLDNPKIEQRLQSIELLKETLKDVKQKDYHTYQSGYIGSRQIMILISA